MFQARWAWAGLCALALTQSADAQIFGASAPASQFMGGVDPSSIVNTVIDTTKLVVAPISPAAPAPAGSALSRFFQRFSFTSTSPVIGSSSLPPPSAFPSTRYPNAFQPRMPVIPPPIQQ